jgi:CBS domain-containing protein
MSELLARDVMSSEVVVVSPKASIIEAAKLMLENRISGLPVIDEQGHLVGVVSEGDLLRRVEIGTQIDDGSSFLTSEVARHFLKSYGRFVEDVMTTKVASVLANTPLVEIARLMELMRLKRVPVIEHGKLIGIVSRADLLRALVHEVESQGSVGAQTKAA